MTNNQILKSLLDAGWQIADIFNSLIEAFSNKNPDKNTSAISVNSISKSFGKIKALDNISLEVKPGSITALLGPNGAGKTTLVRILTTLLKPDSGTAFVAGYDVVKDSNHLRSVIGLSGQYAAVDDILTGRENLKLVGRLYRFNKEQAKKRAEELLNEFGLTEDADRQTKTYSGGMRRRLDLAASLVGKPKILFLDEPTTGLDPRARFSLWATIKNLSAQGATVLLTTQHMEEAEYLSDNIIVLDQGWIIAQGTASELKKRVGGENPTLDDVFLALTGHMAEYHATAK